MDFLARLGDSILLGLDGILMDCHGLVLSSDMHMPFGDDYGMLLLYYGCAHDDLLSYSGYASVVMTPLHQ